MVLSVHDAYMCCPNDRLIVRGRYCGLSADSATCSKCLSDIGLGGFSLERWRESMRQEIAKCDLIVLPSETNKEMWEKIYTLGRYRIVPHGVPLPTEKSRPGKEFSVGFLGYADPAKGEELVKDLVRRLVFLSARTTARTIWKSWSHEAQTTKPVSSRESLSQQRASLTTSSDPARSRATCLWSSSFESSLLIA